tara:strand:+ start:12 stop:242 length:231 start_codon:yes stop_codon:yes gene_type:complete
MRDKIVEQVVDKYYERSQVGITKYGTTLENNNKDNYLLHAQEEAMDLSLYLQKLIEIVRTTPNDQELGEKIRKMVK